MNWCDVDTALGTFRIVTDGNAIVRCHLPGQPARAQGTPAPDHPLLRQAAQELRHWALGGEEGFNVPLAPQGTPFQQAVWEALRTIPPGEVRTYGQVAAAIGRPGAARAVGQANNRNPVAPFVPCHRVVAAHGGLGGYGGGTQLKQAMLAVEQRTPAGAPVLREGLGPLTPQRRRAPQEPAPG